MSKLELTTPQDATIIYRGVTLRRFRQPLYDAEWLPKDRSISEHIFFQRPLGMGFAYPPKNMQEFSNCKQQGDTNLTQAGMLAAPHHFQLRAFGITLPENLGAWSRWDILERGVLQFIYMGTRRIYSLPLAILPCGQIENMLNLESVVQQRIPEQGPWPKQPADAELRGLAMQAAMINKLYTVEDKDSKLLTLATGENFQVKLSWPDGFSVASDTYIKIWMDGWLYE